MSDPAAARESDARFMRRALALARRGWGQTAPNPMVGAVVVRDGAIVGEGHHAAYGAEHAERVALAEAGERSRGATLYVTLEPCNHQGKQPPCAPLVAAAGLRRVVVATRDPNPEATGGIPLLERAGIAVDVGVEEPAARELNAAFFHRFGSRRPWVSLKLAVSIDGAIADAARSRGWLTGPAARREVHRLRADADAIAVGIGTVIADDPLLTVRGRVRPRVAPARVVFDREARLPLGSRLVRTAVQAPLVVVTNGSFPAREAALHAAGARILRAEGTEEALRALRAEGVHSLFAEGGAGLAGALLDARAVDRLIIFRAPILLGGGALPAFSLAPAAMLDGAPRLRVVRQRRLGEDEMTIYAMH
ncbi:MAG: bifunctional diaminohydroxyphosphoribosylaminopyrimidine deaminase/5-amino-6-(5-phosphoribosylamino)uracil reductase RibD [Gemmatimonadaceae bacterium]|nr:bifunctional diaminohydroxyphosphoribosylaminopyrimidine deaminase/5-amino-6-(5-phosphoribosylamino)uracil reductase RibD [Gemmatimonadaceae bacterium]NUQ94394.1 bifunctional diaminohydroxyphosphoribosylaminopyrimidine deaminase/5-amino-6-(5-phosphoribosylamino)uracil reductase RibD [Gemmatimonadaceae bacterium]NUR19204.1 bifunctional diaminohydroxyphosphoribosylaminopyrimidine deaminase/5-amino-6-(5-phosphoribosylamino)uracil reductase RibD [Gemmatimonadaceae bacterium]